MSYVERSYSILNGDYASLAGLGATVLNPYSDPVATTWGALGVPVGEQVHAVQATLTCQITDAAQLVETTVRFHDITYNQILESPTLQLDASFEGAFHDAVLACQNTQTGLPASNSVEISLFGFWQEFPYTAILSVSAVTIKVIFGVGSSCSNPGSNMDGGGGTALPQRVDHLVLSNLANAIYVQVGFPSGYEPGTNIREIAGVGEPLIETFWDVRPVGWANGRLENGILVLTNPATGDELAQGVTVAGANIWLLYEGTQ